MLGENHILKETDRGTDLWLSVRDYLNELSDLAYRFGRKEIDGNEFHGKVKGLLNDSRLKAIPERVRLLKKNEDKRKKSIKRTTLDLALHVDVFKICLVKSPIP